jgi:hypothetical protein
LLNDVAAVLALGHGLNDVAGKLRFQQSLEFQLLHLALKLLRSLLGPALEFLDLPLHGSDGFLLLHDLEAEFFLGVFACLYARDFQPLLYARLDGQLEFTSGIVQFALFANQLGLRLLRLGQLALSLLEHVLQLGDLLGLLLDVARQRAFGPHGGLSLDLGARALEPVLDLGIDAFARFDELLFAHAHGRFSLGHLGLHAVQSLVEIPARGLDERRGQ